MAKNEKLISAVQSALEKLSREGIVGWGLNTLYITYDDDETRVVEFGELIEVGPEHGCTSETCNHVSHDPAAPVLKWIPPEGYRVHEIGEDGERTFYYLANDTEECVIIRVDGGHYHDRLEWGDFDDLPEWMLARLAE